MIGVATRISLEPYKVSIWYDAIDEELRGCARFSYRIGETYVSIDSISFPEMPAPDIYNGNITSIQLYLPGDDLSCDYDGISLELGDNTEVYTSYVLAAFYQFCIETSGKEMCPINLNLAAGVGGAKELNIKVNSRLHKKLHDLVVL